MGINAVAVHLEGAVFEVASYQIRNPDTENPAVGLENWRVTETYSPKKATAYFARVSVVRVYRNSSRRVSIALSMYPGTFISAGSMRA
jgi:hypothetical protein